MQAKITNNPHFKNSIFNDYFMNAPIGFIDIGARFGYHSLLDPIHSHVSFLGFEPDLEECDRLNDNQDLKAFWRNFKVLPHALADVHGQSELKILSLANNSSLLDPNPLIIDRYKMNQKWTVVKTFPLDTVPLDHVLFDLKLGDDYAGEIIKVDTQGTEYEILQGATKTLNERTVCVIAEVEFCHIYKNQKLFSDVEILLREQGFSFYGFLTHHTRSKKSLNKKTHLGRERSFYADAVFFKDPLSAESLNLSSRSLRVLLLSAVITGFYDFALELAASPLLSLSHADIANVNQLIHSVAYLDPAATEEQLSELMGKVNQDKSSTNVLLGKFIDHINFPDFEDCQ